MKCKYCNKEGKYQLKNKAWCCESHPSKCPENKAKNSKGLKKAYDEGRHPTPADFSTAARYLMGASNRNKTAFTHPDQIARAKYKPSEVFIEKSMVSNKTIKTILIAEGNDQCSICNLKEWLGKPIILELDHINGNNRDNRRENIRLLCPNCHSQTDTFRGKNVNTGKVKVSDEELIKAYNEEGNIRRALLKVGLAPKGGNYSRIKKLI